MSSDIQPGDLVVCVDATGIAAPNARSVDMGILKAGQIYECTGIIGPICGAMGIIVAGAPSDHPTRAWHELQFIKYRPFADRFAEQLRTSLPSDERVKEPASC